MMRFVGVRVAVALLAFAAAPVFAQSSAVAPDALASSEQSTVPEELQGMIGDFILEQEDQSAPKCPLTFTDQEAIGGWAIEVPETCPAPYPPADQFVAWNLDDSDGSVILLNAERKVIMRLFEDEDGLYDTDPNVEPRFYLLSPYDEDGTGGEDDGADVPAATD